MTTVIAVTGRAAERAEPELAAVSLSVASSGPDREQTLDRVGTAHERVIADVRRLDDAGALDTWSASQVRVWSHRPWSNEGRQLPLVHDARVEIEVVFRDLTVVGEWVGSAASGDDVTVSGIDWRLTDAAKRRVQEAAQRSAIADAVGKASIYASALGLGAPAPAEIADHGLLTAQPAPTSPVPLRAMAMMSDAAPSGAGPELAPATLVIEASVDARFTAESA